MFSGLRKSTALSGGWTDWLDPAANLSASEKDQTHPKRTRSANRWRRPPITTGPDDAQAAALNTVAAASWMQRRLVAQSPVVLRTNAGTAVHRSMRSEERRVGKECR